MAIYRPPKARWPLAVATGAGGVLVGLLIGLAIGSKDPDPAAAGEDIRATLLSATGSLEVALIEYEEAIGDTGAIESEAEYEGARDAFASSRSRYAEVRPAIAVIVPGVADRLDELYDSCDALVEDRAPPPEVDQCVGRLTQALEGHV